MRPIVVPRSKPSVEKSTKIRRDTWLVGWPGLCYDAHSQTCCDMTLGYWIELLMVLAAAPVGDPLGSEVMSSHVQRADLSSSSDSKRTDPSTSGEVNRTALRLRIQWDGTESCRPDQDVRDGLHRLLGTDPEKLLDEPLLVSARIQRVARGWSLVLSIPGRQGPIERHLDAASCADIAQAASLIISLWIQPSRPKDPTLERDAVVSDTGVTKPIPTPSDPVEPRTYRSRPFLDLAPRVRLGFGAMRVRSSSTLRLRAFAGLTLLHGALPSVGGGVTAGIAASLKRWEVGLAVTWLDSQTLTRLEPIAVSGSFGLWATTARITRSYRLYDSLRLHPGFWALAGRLHAEAASVSMQSSTPSDGDWGAAGVGAGVTWSLRRLVATAELSGGLPFGRPAFWVGEQLLYRTSPVVGFATLGIGAVFP